MVRGPQFEKRWFRGFVLDTISFLSVLIESITVSATDKKNLLNMLEIDLELFVVNIINLYYRYQVHHCSQTVFILFWDLVIMLL